MKHISTLLVFFILVVNCIGQKKDSVEFGSVLSGVRFWATPTNRMNEFIITQNKDTIHILMLVCDTSSKTTGGVIFFNDYEQKMYEGKGLWWQFGYEVSAHGQGYDPDSYPYKEIVKPKWYLDQNKKLLSKSMVVWQTKEIKQ